MCPPAYLQQWLALKERYDVREGEASIHNKAGASSSCGQGGVEGGHTAKAEGRRRRDVQRRKTEVLEYHLCMQGGGGERVHGWRQ